MKYAHRWSPGDALHRACRTGNADLLQTTLLKGADVNYVDTSMARAAAANGKGDELNGSYLLATPLMLAASHGYAELVDSLIASGARVEVLHSWSACESGETSDASRKEEGVGDNCDDGMYFGDVRMQSDTSDDLELLDLDRADSHLPSNSQNRHKAQSDDNEASCIEQGNCGALERRRGNGATEENANKTNDEHGGSSPASFLSGDEVLDNNNKSTSSSHQIWLSAAVAAAAAGQLGILRKLVLDHGADVALECGLQYGEETPLLAAAHNGRQACVEFLLDIHDARQRLPEALEHACFAPSCFCIDGEALPSDFWWIPTMARSSPSSASSSRCSNRILSYDRNSIPDSSSVKATFSSSNGPSKLTLLNKGHVLASVPEPSQRQACCQRLFTEVCVAGRLQECVPFFRHAWNEIMLQHSQDLGLDGLCVPSVPPVIANYNLGFLFESLSSIHGPGALLEAARLYGKLYTEARRLFGPSDEITLTARGDWGACLLRITSPDEGSRTPDAIIAAGLIGEGEPLLRDALRDLKLLRPYLNAANDLRIARWESILMPLQPGRRPLEPMIFLTQQEEDAHYISPTRLEHAMRGWCPGDERIPFPPQAALYPPLDPFQDDLAKIKEILVDLNDVILEEAQLLKQDCTDTEKAVRTTLIAAIKRNWRALIYADIKWRLDRQVVIAAASSCGRSIQAVDVKFRDDYKIGEIAVRQDWHAFKYLSTRLKQKKKLFQIAKNSLMKAIERGEWHALGQADSMLRGDPDVVELANHVSNQAAMFYADRKILAENQSWAIIWPKFRRRCRIRIMWTTCILFCLATVAIISYTMIFIVFVDTIWPPVNCQFSELRMENITNEDGYLEEVEVYREWFHEYEHGYKCNRSLYSPPPEPEFEKIDDRTVAQERKEAEELMKEETVKEEEEKSRRRFRHRRHLVRKRRRDVIRTLQSISRKQILERHNWVNRAAMASEEQQKSKSNQHVDGIRRNGPGAI